MKREEEKKTTLRKKKKSAFSWKYMRHKNNCTVVRLKLLDHHL